MDKLHAITGLILAGGQSSRFGSNKAVFSIGGVPMIEHVYRAVTTLADPVLISLRDDTFQLSPAIKASLVRDETSVAGPLAGLHAGLRASSTDWLLVMATDMPFVSAASLIRLVESCLPGSQAVVATDGERLQPLCACYHRSILPIVEECLASSRPSMYALLDALDVVQAVPFDPRELRNVNRPGDLHTA